MSDTPRTDAEMKRTATMFDRDREGAWMAMVEHGRELEREADSLRREVSSARKHALNAAPQAATGTVPPESSAPAVAAPQPSAKHDSSPEVSHMGGETPRTDYEAEHKTMGGIEIVSADFARKLERELAAALKASNEIAEALRIIGRLKSIISATPREAYRDWALGPEIPYDMVRVAEAFLAKPRLAA